MEGVDGRSPILGVLDDQRWWKDDGNRVTVGLGSKAFGESRVDGFDSDFESGWKSCWTYVGWEGYQKSGMEVGSGEWKIEKPVGH
jgi:hypothetical protein